MGTDRRLGQSKSPLAIRFERTVRADIISVWREFSNTERFNRAMGFCPSWTETANPDGRSLLKGSLPAGMLGYTWRERPYHFEAPRWFQVERVYEAGPIDRYTVELKLCRIPEGTDLVYEVMVFPRHEEGVPAIGAEANETIRPMLAANIDTLCRLLEGEVVDYDPPPPEISSQALERIDGACAEQPSSFAAAMKTHILSAPLYEQVRMHPLELAKRWDLEPNQAIEGCLLAVHKGLLSLHWEMICPSCRHPKGSTTTLDRRPASVLCISCNIKYDAGFPDSVAIVFRTAPSIRQLSTAVHCIGSPARTPHFALQRSLEPRQLNSWSIELTPGAYRLQSWPRLDAVDIRVSDDPGWPDRLTLRVSSSGFRPNTLYCRAGLVAIEIESKLDEALLIVIESREHREELLTAGRLMQLPGAVGLLPSEALGREHEVEVLRSAVLAVESVCSDAATLDPVLAAVEASSPRILYRADRAILATWPTAEGAVRGFRSLAGAMHLYCAVGLGLVTELGGGGEAIPSGAAVDASLAAMRRAIPGCASVPAQAAFDPELKSAVGTVDATARMTQGPNLGEPATWLLSFPDATPAAALLPESELAETDTMSAFGEEFLLDEEIGSGGFGTVLAARRKQDGRRVAIKILHRDRSTKAWDVQLFYNEARLVSNLSSVHTVRVIDFGHTKDGRLYLVMDRLDGRDLSVVLAGGRIGAARTCALTLGVLASLAEAHGNGLVHRDLKPSNILLEPDGDEERAVVLDFGIAKDLSADAISEPSRKMAGTPRYMSPEHIGRFPLTPRSDLYSLGLVMYECLSGAVPGGESQGLEQARARVAEPIVPICDLVAIPERLSKYIDRLLSLNPDDRPASAAEAAVELTIISSTLVDDDQAPRRSAIECTDEEATIADIEADTEAGQNLTEH